MQYGQCVLPTIQSPKEGAMCLHHVLCTPSLAIYQSFWLWILTSSKQILLIYNIVTRTVLVRLGGLAKTTCLAWLGGWLADLAWLGWLAETTCLAWLGGWLEDLTWLGWLGKLAGRSSLAGWLIGLTGKLFGHTWLGWIDGWPDKVSNFRRQSSSDCLY